MGVDRVGFEADCPAELDGRLLHSPCFPRRCQGYSGPRRHRDRAESRRGIWRRPPPSSPGLSLRSRSTVDPASSTSEPLAARTRRFVDRLRGCRADAPSCDRTTVAGTAMTFGLRPGIVGTVRVDAKAEARRVVGRLKCATSRTCGLVCRSHRIGLGLGRVGFETASSTLLHHVSRYLKEIGRTSVGARLLLVIKIR